MMSRMPKVNKKPKNNKSDKFRWVDSQWEKMLSKIDKLEQENTSMMEPVMSQQWVCIQVN